jgi:AraC-like DNA-binding protein
VYLIITTICIALIGILAVRLSNRHILRQVSIASERALESKVSILEERLSKVNSITYQTMYDEATFRLLWSESEGSSNLLIMRDVIRDFRSIARSHRWIDSMYFYDSRNAYVLGDTKIDKLSFPDKVVLSIPPSDELSVVGPRLFGGEQLLTIGRAFSFFGRSLTGFVVINVEYAPFFEMFEINDPASRFIVLSDSGELMYPPNASLSAPSLKSIQVQTSGETVDIDGSRFFMVKDEIRALEWNIVYLQEYGEVVRAAELVGRLIAVSAIGVLILAVVLLWLAARRLHKPLGHLAQQARKLVGSIEDYTDEYQIVDAALRNLLMSNLELNERYKTALPYFRRYSIEELMHTKQWDTSRFQAIVSLLGVHFARSYFHIALIETDEGLGPGEIRRQTEEYLHDHGESLSFVAAETHEARVALIINTDATAIVVYTILSGLRNELLEAKHRATIALSAQFEDLSQIPTHFSEAEEQIEHRAFLGDDQVIFDFNRPERFVPPTTIDLPIEPVVNAVREQDAEETSRALGEFALTVVARAKGDTTTVRFAFYELAMRIQTLLPSTRSTEQPSLSRMKLYQAIQASNHADELTTLLQEEAERTVAELARIRSEHHNELVRRSIAYMGEHLGDPVSIDHIAEAVFISARYLNSLFKQQTGQTAFEYLSKMRVEYAQALLREHDLQVQEVATRVGYVNVQSFIRLFKRHNGMTPIEYRRLSEKKRQ